MCEEVAGSKRDIESALGREIAAFTYPNGDYDAEVRRVVTESGYALAFTTMPGVVDVKDDPYSIKRVNVHEGGCPSIPLFMARIAGIL
jgi:peptidoglycan/xylan/chitin deacetylase (PgdA/CDA1 family)